MITEQLDRSTKAVIIEIADIFHEMPYEEYPEDLPWKEEEKYHMRVIEKAVKKAQEEGYTHWKFLNKAEAVRAGQNIGKNGIYLLVFKKIQKGRNYGDNI